ncbi:hormogonium polysaccharide biosynthesis protein HpsA [Pantanalinema rosaneae CENA516]|uniref:hormogonium polysaccharide biosynthesis protein HpsA n=1 Tax=Pantanalinema rosaneae TaxID=1620701 RepID=UPI003D6FCC43
MSDRKLAKAAQILFRQIGRLYRSLSKGVITWLLRTMLVVQRRDRRAIAGFVLPTTILLILVVALTAGAITFRAFNSSTRTISETQNRVIYNAATPAIDRARAKLEFLFDDKKDNRYPGGVPSENVLASMMLNNGATVRGRSVAPLLISGRDAYTLADETRVDINGDGVIDNAWRYQDANTNSTVIYSVNFMTPPDDTGANAKKGWQKLIEATDTTKANGVRSTVAGATDSQSFPLVRTGPLSNANAVTCGRNTTGQTNVEGGWYEDATNTAILRKRFQVDALVIPNTAGNPGAASNFTTLEFAQDRQLDRGNKWGAWFRNDLEIFPGPAFQWNGAMHTEGSLILGNTAFSAYLISAPASCLYIESASEITVTQLEPTAPSPSNPSPPNNGNPFYGVIAAGRVNNNAYGGSALIYPHRNNPIGTGIAMTSANDWATGSTPLGISLDPVQIVTRDGYVARNADPDNSSNLTVNQTFQGRFRASYEPAPYVDDTYRADDRYGPKPIYKNNTTDDNGDGTPDGEIPSSGQVGDLIPSSNTLLVANTAAGADASQLGLDGYWERRARNQGLRILVGQRLELGNSYGWVTPQSRTGKPAPVSGPLNNPAANAAFVQAYPQPAPTATETYTTVRNRVYATGATGAAIDIDASDNEGDPLYPPYGTTQVSHEARQRRALRDNPAAVQATAVYHAAVNRDYPIACIASTTHPGSPITLRQSINFVPTRFIDSTPATAGGSGINSAATTGLLVDFFNGRGTNGWEFETPGLTQAGFEAAISSPTSSLRIALQNLANFAGDHISDARTGAFPPTQEAGQIHPDPELTMWGNFSNLRRTLARLNSTGYTNLSIADKTYLQTAGCTLGMLAYNVEQADKFDPRNWRNDSSNVMTDLYYSLIRLMNGDVSDGEVLTRDRLATYGYSNSGTFQFSNYEPRDYDRVPAEAYLGALREQIIADGGSPNDPKIRMAELIYTHFQIRRDRTYGFRASPAANTWNYNPYVTNFFGKVQLWSSACDPNLFALNVDAAARTTGAAGAVTGSPGRPGGDQTVNRMRLAFSRLCGTVIPPGATREYPGDLNLPARSNNVNNVTGAGSNNNPTGTTFIPINTAPTPNTYEPRPQDIYADKAPAGFLQVFRQTSPTNVTVAPYNARPYVQATVAPKWPSLYYLFPNFSHRHAGTIETIGGVCVDHRQPNGSLRAVTGCAESGNTEIAAFQPWAEPYITDSYVTTANGSVTYEPVNSAAPLIADPLLATGYPASGVSANFNNNAGNLITFNYQTFDTAPVAESSLSGVALRPRKLPGAFNNPLFLDSNPTWQLPVTTLSGSYPAQNTPPNRIMAPNGANVTGTVAVIPFLDRVLFNGREWLPTRVLDIDLGMLRRNRPANQVAGDGDNYAPNDVWLPVSGIVYAFREDATREDAIARPASGTATNARVPGSETDPAVTSTGTRGISTKSVDFIPDPDRRPHGFRLRNGTQLKRHSDMAIPDTDNVRGLSLFTDNPVYIMGDYNLHQTGGEDVVGTRLEEFLETLPDNAAYTEAQFYNRSTIDNRFADPTQDRWRPSEILADAISILSDTFCDGSIMDGFMTAGNGSGASLSTTTDPNESRPASAPLNVIRGVYQPSTGNTGGGAVYNNTNAALFGPGCTTTGRTSFLNQNRPSTNPRPNGADFPRWFRENPTDKFTPIQVSRNGNGIIEQAPRSTAPSTATDTLFWQKPVRPTEHPSTAYYNIRNSPSDPGNNNRPLQNAQDTRVNSIVISGSVPSQARQSYGGLHNFPRFLETWTRLWFAGAFLQLNFSNYATSPFDADAWEPGEATVDNEIIGYYAPPNRLWGYDVALQLAPAGPAANRFVTPSKQRNEFYNEPAVSDPYMKNLCQAIRSNPPAGTNLANLRCPT